MGQVMVSGLMHLETSSPLTTHLRRGTGAVAVSPVVLSAGASTSTACAAPPSHKSPRVAIQPRTNTAISSGVACGWLASADGPTQVRDVAEAVAALVRQGVPMSEIAVLYARAKIGGVANLPEALVEALEARGVLAQWAARDTASKRVYDITTDSVTVSTIYSAKGLDYAHVFLLGLDTLNPDEEKDRRLAYVGVTRARERLTLGLCRSGENWCKLWGV